MSGRAFLLIQFHRRSVLIEDNGCFAGIVSSGNVFGLFHHGILRCAVDECNPTGGGVEPYFVFQILPVQPKQTIFDTVGGIVREPVPGMVAKQIAEFGFSGVIAQKS